MNLLPTCQVGLRRTLLRVVLLVAVSCLVGSLTLAQSVSDYARLSATVQTSPPRLTLPKAEAGENRHVKIGCPLRRLDVEEIEGRRANSSWELLALCLEHNSTTHAGVPTSPKCANTACAAAKETSPRRSIATLCG